MRNPSKMRPLDFEKKMIAQLRKMFPKIPMNTYVTISVLLLCSFAYTEVLFDFEGWFEKALHRKTLVIGCLYACNFIKKWLQHSCFPMNFTKYSRTYILWNICEQQLLLFFWLWIFLMFFWYNKVLSYPCSIKYLLWKPLLESRTLLKRHFIILEYCLQFSDNFLYGILRDFFVTKQYVNENNHWNMIAKKYFSLNKSLKESNLIRREETLLLCTIYCYIRTFILVIINATLFLLLWTMKCFSHLCNITGRL